MDADIVTCIAYAEVDAAGVSPVSAVGTTSAQAGTFPRTSVASGGGE
jgi:hypothetical protein